MGEQVSKRNRNKDWKKAVETARWRLQMALLGGECTCADHLRAFREKVVAALEALTDL